MRATATFVAVLFVALCAAPAPTTAQFDVSLGKIDVIISGEVATPIVDVKGGGAISVPVLPVFSLTRNANPTDKAKPVTMKVLNGCNRPISVAFSGDSLKPFKISPRQSSSRVLSTVPTKFGVFVNDTPLVNSTLSMPATKQHISWNCPQEAMETLAPIASQPMAGSTINQKLKRDQGGGDPSEGAEQHNFDGHCDSKDSNWQGERDGCDEWGQDKITLPAGKLFNKDSVAGGEVSGWGSEHGCELQFADFEPLTFPGSGVTFSLPRTASVYAHSRSHGGPFGKAGHVICHYTVTSFDKP